MRSISSERIPVIHEINFSKRIGSPNPHFSFKLAKELHDLKISRFPFLIYFILVFSGIFFSQAPSAKTLYNQGTRDTDCAANEDAQQPFGHSALSSKRLGGGKLCQEAPRLVTIIGINKSFFNVNFLNILGAQGAIA